jgi:hypothetical protein
MYDPNAVALIAEWMPVFGIIGLVAFAALIWWVFVS